MDKKAIFDHYSTFLDHIIDTSPFFAMYFQNPYYLDEDICGQDEDHLPVNINFSCGATRCCIVDEDYDYVVKFDIEEDYEYGSSCSREEEIYSHSIVEGVNTYLCECMFLGCYTHTIDFYDYSNIENMLNWGSADVEGFEKEFYNNIADFGTPQQITISIPLYAYPRADDYDCGIPSYEEKCIVNCYESPLKERNQALAAAFIREYGEEEYVKFTDFAYEYDINDLHLANIGSVDGKLCLIDYAGYHEA